MHPQGSYAPRQRLTPGPVNPTRRVYDQLMAQRYANCIWVVITQYGKIGNLVRAKRTGTCAPSAF